MQKPIKDQYQFHDKAAIAQQVNIFSALSALAFGIICIYILRINEILPYIFLGFGVLVLMNILAYKSHGNLTLTYNFTSILGLISAIGITLYSGGINSPFIFILALIVFAGYVTTRGYGRVYLILNIAIIGLIYMQHLPRFNFSYNVVPEESKNLFSLLSILFSVYLLGGVFGKNLQRTQYKLYKSKLEIEKRIAEKEMLLKEIHHRVKNNLQTVSSLLSLQSRATDDTTVKNLFKSSQNRVISMAMVHEMLYMRDDLSKIEYKSYVQELSEYLVRSVKGTQNNIKLTIDIPDIKLGIDTAIPLGLLINETITNALKYGIKDDSDGEIHIALKKEAGTDYVLNIGDNGVGFSDTVNHKNTKSLGLKLIYNLARQLQGSIIRDGSQKGTNYIVRFQEIGQSFHSIA